MIKNVLQLFISNLLFGVSQFLIILCLNKFGSLEDVGQYSLGLAIVGPIFVFLNMSLNLHFNTNKENPNFNDYLLIRILTSIIAIIFSVLLSMILGYKIDLIIIIFLLSNLKLLESIMEINYALLQSKGKHDKIAQGKTLRSLSLIFIILLLIWFSKFELYTFLILIILINIVILLFEISRIKKYRSNIKISSKKIKIIIFSSVPLAISSTFDSLNINAQRLIIEKFISIEELAIYASLTTLMISGQVLISAIMTYFLPVLNSHIKNNKLKEFKKIMKIVVSFSGLTGIILTVVIIFIGDWMLGFLFTEVYKDYKPLAILIMMAGTFWYMAGALNYCVISLNLYKEQMAVVILSFFSMILITIWLINTAGIYGAVYGLIMSMIVRIIGFYYFIQIRMIRNVE